MKLNASLDANWPQDTDWEVLAGKVAAAAAKVAPELANARLEVSLLFTTDAQMRALNRCWRGKDKPTNVLSFPMLKPEELLALTADGPPVLLGDIALAYETCASEASKKAIPLEHHAAHLLIHGLLHLAGHDHELGQVEAEAMEALESKALALMGIANPYESQD
ncbi:MAG: rRNA maturation RNase YbeY [Novosphingobium sp.]|nr:rRNA maturation RNase YbeY [Novosphingobium sp.]